MLWILLALAAGLLFGLKDIMEKRVLKIEHSSEYLSVLFIISFLLLLPAITMINFQLSIESLVLIIARSMISVIYFLAFTKALKHLSISTVAPLANVRSVFALVLGVVLLMEPVSLASLMGILVIFFGSYLLDSEGHPKNFRKPLHDLVHSKYMHYIGIFSFFVALAAILDKIILAGPVSSLDLLFFTRLFLMVVFLAITFGLYKGTKDLKEGWKKGNFWIVLIAIASLIGVFAKFLALANPLSKVAIVVPLLLVASLVDVILGGRIFKDKNLGVKIIGSLLIILGAVMLVL